MAFDGHLGAPRLVGRHAERWRLHQLLTSSRRRAAVVAGPAGVGKSRLADELADAAEAAGWTVVRARGSRAAATIPLGALAHLLPDDPGRGATRLEVLHRALTHLTRLAADTRLLVVVDDAHHLDEASATLAHLMVTASPAVTLLTIRSEEASPDPIVGIWLDGHADRIDLAPLSRRETEELAEVLLGGEVDRATLAELWRLTRGNALLAVETIRAARAAGVLRRAGGMWHHGGSLGSADRLAAVIDGRLAHLEAADRAVLELLAVGEPVPVAVLERAVAPGSIERLERYGLVEVTTQGQDAASGGSIRTLHPLYGEVLRDRMPRTRVRAATRQLADALDAIGARRREDVFRLALWRLEAGQAGDPAVLTEAARWAVNLFEHDLAERLASAALTSGADDRARLALAEALAGLGRGDAAEREFARIAATSSGPALAAVTVPRAWNLALQVRDGAAALSVLRSAAAGCDDRDAVDELVAVEATLRSFLGDLDGALEASQRILSRPGAADRVVLQALTIFTIACALRGRPVTAMPGIDRGLALAERIDEPVPLAATKLRVSRILASAFEGDLLEAERVGQACYLDALERNARHDIGAYGVSLTHVLVDRGRISACVKVLAETSVAVSHVDPLAVAPACAGLRALALAQSGDLPGAEAALDDHDRRHPEPHRFVAHVRRARAWLEVQRGRSEAAVSLAREAGLELRAAGFPVWAAWILHDVVRFGAPELVVGDLAELAGTTEGRLVPALAEHAAAVVSGRAGAIEGAAADLADLGADLVAAEAYAAAARAHRQEGREESARKADRHSRRLARGCVGARTPGITAPAIDLTARQREVARLAASGLTNREIGELLRVSSRTIDNHLAQVYARLGIAGRSELAAAIRLDPEADVTARDRDEIVGDQPLGLV